MPDTLPLLDAALRGMVLALLLLLAGLLWRERPGLPAARVGVLIALGLVLQVVSAAPAFEARVPALWQTPFIAVSVGNAVLFWVFVQALFVDGFRLRPVHAIAWGSVLGLSTVNCLFNCLLPGVCQLLPGPLPVLLRGLQRAVPLLFSVLAVLATLAHWRSDLVEGRRRLRLFVVVAGTFYTLVMLAARLGATRGRLSQAAASADVAMLLVLVAVMAWGLLRVGGSDLFAQDGPAAKVPAGMTLAPTDPSALPPATAPAVASPVMPAPCAAVSAAAADPADDRLAAALHRVMSEDRAYRSDDLSVASLAARLRVPEYRLRRLINQRLGHRNFNVFVNGWRLDEVRAALADPAQREVPVLTIALDAGFQSIGPFNRAFKTATGITPTEFRRAALPRDLTDS